MNRMIKSTFIFTFISLIIFNAVAMSESDYSDKQDKASESLFFPKETALRDGYRITPDEWISLDANQKKNFIIEGIREIKNKENCSIRDIVDMVGLINNFDKTIQVLAFNRTKTAAICILFRMLYAHGYSECDEKRLSSAREEIMSYVNNPISPTVEVFKIYSGYTDFYEKNGNWFMRKRPPKIGETIRHFIYSNYNLYPNGMVLLLGNYPLEFTYKIKSIKEINSVLQSSGLMAHYYEVTFECRKK